MFYDNLENYLDHPALVDDSGAVKTYQELTCEADEICAGVSSRQLVFILCQNEIESICGYVGFLRKRVVPVMLDAQIEIGLLRSLIEKYRPAYVYCPIEKRTEIVFSESLWIGEKYCLLELDRNEACVKVEQLALLLTTSGSTGSPKLVKQSYANIQSNAEAIVTYLELNADEKPIVTLPMHYTYGLSIIHSHLQVGATILVTRYPVNNKNFWDFFRREGATSFGGVPYTYEMLKRIHFFKMELPTLKTMTQAGGKLSMELHEEFAAYAMKMEKRFVVMYGQTEATARMSYLPAEKSLEKIGSIGIPIPGGRLELINIEGKKITEPFVTGELIYSGPNVTMGYAESREDLDGGDMFKGILHTGDMAQYDEDGFLYVVGRLKRFLKLFGSRINLDEVDRLIRKNFCDLECATSGTDEKMISYITDAQKLDVVKKFILETMHVNSSAVEVRYISEIPKNSAGKILYKVLEDM